MTATDFALPVLGGKRVLVIDADEDGAASLTAVLRLSGCDAHAARTGAEALRAVVADPPCVVLMELQLPDADPLGIIRQIRAVPTPPAVVVVTGDGRPAHRRAATAAGAAAYLLKPADPGAVVRLVLELCV
jgi:CheY-like chemotaxis protein